VAALPMGVAIGGGGDGGSGGREGVAGAFRPTATATTRGGYGRPGRDIELERAREDGQRASIRLLQKRKLGGETPARPAAADAAATHP